MYPKLFDQVVSSKHIFLSFNPTNHLLIKGTNTYISFFPYENHCKCYKKLVSILWPMLFTLKACVHYFLLFLNVFLHYLEPSTFKGNLTYNCFFFPLFHEHLFSPELPCATRLLETSCLEKITVCVIETTLVMLLLVQMNKAQREVNRTNQVQTKKNIMKGLQTSVTHLIPGSTCH